MVEGYAFGGGIGDGVVDAADGGDEAGDLHFDGVDVCAIEEGDEEGDFGAGGGGGGGIF